MSLIETFKSRPSSSRQMFIVLAVFAVICVAAVGLYVSVFHKPYKVLFNHLRPSDAATIVAELDKKKVPYRLQDGGATILAPEDQIDATRLSIMSEDLPIKGGVGFELFNKSDMGLTEFAQKINYQRALQGELARTIGALDPVDSARVHLSLPDSTLFREDRQAAKASATIATKPGRFLSVGAVAGIRRLIAAAVPDLDASNVVILDEEGDVVSGDAGPTQPLPPPSVEEQQAIENYYAAKIRQAVDRDHANVDIRVTIPATMTAASAGRPSQVVWKDWTPRARQFSLTVSINSEMPLSEQDRAEIRRAIQAAIGSAPQTPDEIVFSASIGEARVADAASSAPGPASLHLAPTTQASQASLPSGIAWMIGGLLLVAMAGAAGVLARSAAKRHRNLTEDERNGYVAQFKALLGEGAARARVS